MHHLRKMICLLAASALVACSSGGNLTTLSSTPGVGLPPEPSLRLNVTPGVKDSVEVLSDVRVAILGQLLATGRYSKVTVSTEPTDLVMNVDIIKYAKVTVGERVFLGVLAGRNRLGAHVTIVETANNATLKSFDAEGESAAHVLSSESGFSDAVREVAKQIGTAAPTG